MFCLWVLWSGQDAGVEGLDSPWGQPPAGNAERPRLPDDQGCWGFLEAVLCAPGHHMVSAGQAARSSAGMCMCEYCAFLFTSSEHGSWGPRTGVPGEPGARYILPD